MKTPQIYRELAQQTSASSVKYEKCEDVEIVKLFYPSFKLRNRAERDLQYAKWPAANYNPKKADKAPSPYCVRLRITSVDPSLVYIEISGRPKSSGDTLQKHTLESETPNLPICLPFTYRTFPASSLEPAYINVKCGAGTEEGLHKVLEPELKDFLKDLRDQNYTSADPHIFRKRGKSKVKTEQQLADDYLWSNANV